MGAENESSEVKATEPTAVIAEVPKATEEVKPVEEAKSIEEPKPVEEAKSVEETKPAEESKASVTPETKPSTKLESDAAAPAAEPATESTTASDSNNIVAPAEASKETPKESSSEKSVSFDKDTKAHDGNPNPSTPIGKLLAELPSIFETAGHNEMWGIVLQNSDEHVQTSIVLEKFLRANNKDVSKAKSQLIEALKWRKTMQPQKLLEDTEFDKAKYGGLGYVTTYTTSGGKEIITWNIYGAVKELKKTFGDVAEFIKWRTALMELSIKELDLASATEKIPENGPDPYRMIQVHDYLNISFLRMDPAVRAASKETIQTFSMAYPELLKEKFFVNVPVIMGWVFAAMKVFLSAETVKKFHPLSYGSSLAGEIPGVVEQLPKGYGGKGGELKDGLTVKYADAEAAAPEK